LRRDQQISYTLSALGQKHAGAFAVCIEVSEAAKLLQLFFFFFKELLESRNMSESHFA